MSFNIIILMCCVVVSGVGLSYGTGLALRNAARNTRKPGVTGFTMGEMKYDGGEIKTVQPGEWEWKEVGKCSPRKYKTVGRDEWSVYLCGEKDGDLVQMDYGTGQLSHDDVVVQNITDAETGGVTGRNIGLVEFENGVFNNVGWKRWELHLHSGAHAINYTETSREPWGVKLQGANRRYTLYADYQRKWISSISLRGIKTDLHKIRYAEHSAVQYRLGCGGAQV